MKRDFVGWICIRVDRDKPLSACESLYILRDVAEPPGDAIAALYLVHGQGHSFYMSESLFEEVALVKEWRLVDLY